jgi:hypothetical protein
VAATVDATLRGQPAAVEIRSRLDDGSIERRLEAPDRFAAGSDRTRRNGARGQLAAGAGPMALAGVVGSGGAAGPVSPVGLGGRGGLDGDATDRGDPPTGMRRHGRRGGYAEFRPSTLPQPLEWRTADADPDTAVVAAGTSLGDGGSGALDETHVRAALPSGAVDERTGGRFQRAAPLRPVRLYPYGVNRDRLEAAIAGLRVPVTLTKDVRDADVVMTLKNYYRKSPGPVRDAESAGKPVFILRSNTTLQIQQSLEALYGLETADPPRDIQDLVLRETQDAIDRVLQTARPVELPPQNAYVRRLQHQLAEQFNVGSRSTGREPHRRVRLFRPGTER